MFRYPGGKAKAKKFITSKIKKYYKVNNSYDLEYVEPFFGSGSICFSLINSIRLTNICINDSDPGIACLWATVIHFPEKLCKMVEDYIPSVNDFYTFKKELRSFDMNFRAKAACNRPSEKCIEVGFKKLVIHKISYSGLGTMAGGPIGGKEQTSDFKIDCRYNYKTIIKEIRECHRLFKNVDGSKLRAEQIRDYGDFEATHKEDSRRESTQEMLKIKGINLVVNPTKQGDELLAINHLNGRMKIRFDGSTNILIHPRCVNSIRCFSGAWVYETAKIKGFEYRKDTIAKIQPWVDIFDADKYYITNVIGPQEIQAIRQEQRMNRPRVVVEKDKDGSPIGYREVSKWAS